MRRIIESELNNWKKQKGRKPLLLRGARQVGKTYLAQNLGASFDHFVEINFDFNPSAITIFDKDLDPVRITREISLLTEKPIIPDKTLLFLDEIQEAPNAIKALRYFYEKMPDLHVIAAGSLIDFAIEKIGIPVGRVTSLYVFPLSFIEFLYAMGDHLVIKEIITHDPSKPISDVIHAKLLRKVGEFLAIGGMPEAIKKWRDTQDPFTCFQVHSSLADNYRQDFQKYATKYQVPYVEYLFNQVPHLIGTKFKYSNIEGDFRKRELEPCLELLCTAGVCHKVMHTSGQGIPLGATVNFKTFKVLFVDTSLAQHIMGLKLKEWFLNPQKQFINQGNLVEAFVGQEMLAYTEPHSKPSLYYWQREARGAQAEVDYIIQKDTDVIPVEVKSGTTGQLKSLEQFLKSHKNTPYSIRFSQHNYSTMNHLHSYPLYAIINIFEHTKKNILNDLLK